MKKFLDRSEGAKVPRRSIFRISYPLVSPRVHTTVIHDKYDFGNENRCSYIDNIEIRNVLCKRKEPDIRIRPFGGHDLEIDKVRFLKLVAAGKRKAICSNLSLSLDLLYIGSMQIFFLNTNVHDLETTESLCNLQ
jgi:hypothetical protein